MGEIKNKEMKKISLIQLSETTVTTKLVAVVAVGETTYNVPLTIVNHMNGNCDFIFNTKGLPVTDKERHTICKAIADERFNRLSDENE